MPGRITGEPSTRNKVYVHQSQLSWASCFAIVSLRFFFRVLSLRFDNGEAALEIFDILEALEAFEILEALDALERTDFGGEPDAFDLTLAFDFLARSLRLG